jgi:hypothetical protein
MRGQDKICRLEILIFIQSRINVGRDNFRQSLARACGSPDAEGCYQNGVSGQMKNRRGCLLFVRMMPS